MRSCCIYYWDNGVGVKVDVQLIYECLIKQLNCDIFDFSYLNGDTEGYFSLYPNKKYDIGIFNQNFSVDLLHNNKINIYICNEEWLGLPDIENLQYFDYIIVKNNYAKELLKDLHKNIICLYFWSRDLYNSNYNNITDNKLLHFAGKSIQKNTECILNNEDIYIFDSTGRYSEVRSINYISSFISDIKLKHIFNTCNTHICPSLYEAHGHYMYEALLCNKNIIASKIPVWEEQIDPDYINFVDTSLSDDESYEFVDKDNKHKFPYRKSFFVNQNDLDKNLYNTNNKPPRKFIEDLFIKNQKGFFDFFKSI